MCKKDKREKMHTRENYGLDWLIIIRLTAYLFTTLFAPSIPAKFKSYIVFFLHRFRKYGEQLSKL